MAIITHVELPAPPMGGKCWLLEDKGIYVLERGPGTLRTDACTHAGAGQLIIYDGVPDENGYFGTEEMSESDPGYWSRNGRPIYKANPVVMGSWMLDAGFYHGLTIKATGGERAAAIASIVWVAHRARTTEPVMKEPVKEPPIAVRRRAPARIMEIADVYTPPAPGSLMRAASITLPGTWRLARRDAELYSVQIVSSGAWGRARVSDGNERALWFQPSTFTGSFWLGAGAEDGLLVELSALDVAANLTVNWRERDQRVL